jgi:PAT family beta-lactamase induction signal transducer AmpG
LRSTLLGAGLAVTIQIGAGLLGVIAPLLLVQRLGWTEGDYSRLGGGWGLAAGLLGAVGGGFAADFIGHKRMIALSSVTLGMLWAAFALGEPYWTVREFIVAEALLESLIGGFVSVGFFALAMDLSWPRVAATQFTAYMALLNVSTTIGTALAAPLDVALDYRAIYFCAAALASLPAVLLLWVDPGQARRDLG